MPFCAMKTAVLSLVALFFPYNWKYDRYKYPQLMGKMPRNKWLRTQLQSLCERFGGHELSETDHGYGGGDTMDCWCRWCDKLIPVPMNSLPQSARTFAFDHQEAIDAIRNERLNA